MSTATELTAFVDDLAGRWTDRVLENLRAAGNRGVSIDMELATWRALKKVLCEQLSHRFTQGQRRPGQTDFMPRFGLAAANPIAVGSV